MRRMLIALSMIAAVVLTLSVAACSAQGNAPSAQAPASAEGTVKVQAGTGTERFPVPMVAVGISACSASAVLATLTTGHDGAATRSFPVGCYRATVTSVPDGCQADAVANTQVDVKPAGTATANFLIHCA
ncbi:hypothetical protein KO481_24955 [Nocardia sp. NEAU-G5]|uniref:Lipoprotein n=1 Tax=Nocardia albiluteola TaxID=2842303 RepID=A0ABS6B5Z6_9NOCA|nr:hypothetical protein [Nocardia albiluteola]MBU3064765.1 hypothetical protein [Nocardia albiluteola]